MSENTSAGSESADGGASLGVRVRRRYRLYGKAYQYSLALCWLMQGKRCFYHFVKCTNRPEVIAHKDHNPDNWDPENLAGSCRFCNSHISNLARGSLKGRSVNIPMRVSAVESATLADVRWQKGEQLPTDPVSINRVKEPMFKKWAKDFLEHHGRFEKTVFIRRAAHDVGVSIDTIRDRYLPKYSVYPGFLQIIRDDSVGAEFVELRYSGSKVEEDESPASVLPSEIPEVEN